jgi:hypothetical protein
LQHVPDVKAQEGAQRGLERCFLLTVAVIGALYGADNYKNRSTFEEELGPEKPARYSTFMR